MLLQPGYMYAFAQPVEESKPPLSTISCGCLSKASSSRLVATPCWKSNRSFTIDRTHELDQDAARLVAELDGKTSTVQPSKPLRLARDAVPTSSAGWNAPGNSASKNPAEPDCV